MKLLWFSGDARVPEWVEFRSLSMQRLLSLAPGDGSPELELVLVPDDADLSGVWGDDWDDAYAEHNAGAPYEDRLPEGSVVLRVRLNERFPGNKVLGTDDEGGDEVPKEKEQETRTPSMAEQQEAIRERVEAAQEEAGQGRVEHAGEKSPAQDAERRAR